MRRIAALSALILTGGLLGPSAALAGEDEHDHENRWIAVQEDFVIVLPNGDTFTDDGTAEEDPGLPPVGTRLFIGEALYEAKDGDELGDEVGRTHIDCTAQVTPVYFRCDITFVFDAGSQLHGTVVFDFGEEASPEPMAFDIAVTGGTDDFFGATGEVSFLDITPRDHEAVTTALYEADVRLAHD